MDAVRNERYIKILNDRISVCDEIAGMFTDEGNITGVSLAEIRKDAYEIALSDYEALHPEAQSHCKPMAMSGTCGYRTVHHWRMITRW
jgi:hypothetical protein